MINDGEFIGVSFSYTSPDGEEGYPGNLQAEVTYLLTMDNQLIMRYKATSDQPTIVNFTYHSYFNLTGFKNPHIYDHQLKVHANSFTEKMEIMFRQKIFSLFIILLLILLLLNQ